MEKTSLNLASRPRIHRFSRVPQISLFRCGHSCGARTPLLNPQKSAILTMYAAEEQNLRISVSQFRNTRFVSVLVGCVINFLKNRGVTLSEVWRAITPREFEGSAVFSVSYAFNLRSATFALLLLSALAIHPASAQFSGPGVRTTNPNLNSEAITTDPALLRPVNPAIYMNPGDLVTVHIFGSPDYIPSVRVTLDNTLQLPLIGVVSVKGLTIAQTENLIADRLKSAGMFRDPQVTIQIVESTNGVITISGEAHAVIPATSARPLLEVLAAAGGLPINASHTITVDRPNVDKPIVVDLGNDPMHSKQINIPLYPGDTVIVSRVGVVYMLGEFKTSGVIPIQENSPLTLLQATTAAGGTLYDGKYQDMRIIRTVDDKRSLVRVDIKRVMLGKDPDPLLQADDIVYLPTSYIKSAIVSGGLNLLVNVANLALIAAKY